MNCEHRLSFTASVIISSISISLRLLMSCKIFVREQSKSARQCSLSCLAQLSSVVSASIDVPQPLCRLLGRQISLGLAEHLESNEELPHRLASQQRRIEVDVELSLVPLGLLSLLLRCQLSRVTASWSWSLVHSHGVGEGALEEVVIAQGDLAHDLSKGLHLRGGKVEQIVQMRLARQDKDLQRRARKRLGGQLRLLSLMLNSCGRITSKGQTAQYGTSAIQSSLMATVRG